MKEYLFESLDRVKGLNDYELLVCDEGVKLFLRDSKGVVIGTQVWCGLTNYGVYELLDCLDEYFDKD